jgi:hypothetical protein
VLSHFHKSTSHLARFTKGIEGYGVFQVSTGPFFIFAEQRGLTQKHASELNMNYRVIGEPSIDGAQATVKFTQSFNFVASGKAAKNSATVVMQLKRLQGAPGNWLIDSIR